MWTTASERGQSHKLLLGISPVINHFSSSLSVYCKVHLVVNPKIRFAVGLLFRLRALVRLLKKLSNAYLLKQIDGVMTMMEVSEERKYGWRLSE